MFDRESFGIRATMTNARFENLRFTPHDLEGWQTTPFAP
jgi:hypothetical protein